MTGEPIRELPEVLSGPRLDLVLLSVEQVLSRDGTRPPVALGFDDPDDILDPDDSPLHHRIPQVRADPTVNPWLMRLAVLRDPEPVIVGLANFHDRPDERGMVEIGYRVLPAHRRKGYATEMASTMWTYAVQHPDVRVLRATVSPDNEPSLTIIRGFGFRHVGEQDDPEDGLELIYELGADEFRADESRADVRS
jgi:RimJ/RimL family protein N-acetyltransferase